MKKDVLIPQHALRNGSGQLVDFDLVRWGQVQGYDFHHAHRHAFHEMLFFEQGGGRHDIDFNTYTAETGAVHFVASDNVHLLLRDVGSAGYSILFTEDYLPGGLVELLPFSKAVPVLELDGEEFGRVNGLAKEIGAELAHPGMYSDRMIRTLMETLVLHLVRVHQRVRPVVEEGLPGHVVAFKQLVRQGGGPHDTVEAYAGRLGISTKHLIELCKRHTGKTPLKLIQEHVVAEAKKQLFHTDLSVKEIAYGLHFDEPGNFSKYFKALTGYTPVAYRRGIRS